MIKSIVLLIIIAFLSACSGGGGSDTETAETAVVIQTESIKPLTYIWYGDSRCAENHYIENRDCVGGRTLMDLTEIDLSYDVVIIHFGLNDMWVYSDGSTLDPSVWGEHLSSLIQGSDKVWCVLPTWFNYQQPSEKVAAFRQEMIDHCPNTVDPNIDPYAGDQKHYTDVNYQQVREALDDIISQAQYQQSNGL